MRIKLSSNWGQVLFFAFKQSGVLVTWGQVLLFAHLCPRKSKKQDLTPLSTIEYITPHDLTALS